MTMVPGRLFIRAFMQENKEGDHRRRRVDDEACLPPSVRSLLFLSCFLLISKLAVCSSRSGDV